MDRPPVPRAEGPAASPRRSAAAGTVLLVGLFAWQAWMTLTLFGPGATALATAAGLLVWWGDAGRRALEAGDLDLHLAALAVLAQAGLLLRYDREPSLTAWLGLVLTGALAWFAHPLLVLTLSPLF